MGCPHRSFLFPGRLPVSEARFGSRAPATVVACSSSEVQICVWALHGFLLARVDISQAACVQGLRVISDHDTCESLLYTTEAGHVEIRTLPYLELICSRKFHSGLRPTALDCV